MKWGEEFTDKELGKAEVLHTFFVLDFPDHICSMASQVPGASANMKYSSWQKIDSPERRQRPLNANWMYNSPWN